MSLIVTIKTMEGFIMAGDSRASMQIRQTEEAMALSGIRHYSDTFSKVFSAPNGAGISFCGEMATSQGNVHYFADRFLKEEVSADMPLEELPKALFQAIKQLEKVPSTIFHVCGYDRGEPRLWRVIPKKGVIEAVGEKNIIWDGEGDILARLISPVSIRNPKGEMMPLPDYPVALNLFTLQDAAEFADFALNTTMDAMRFQVRPKTVGGAVDLLAITPERYLWLRKKELGVSK